MTLIGRHLDALITLFTVMVHNLSTPNANEIYEYEYECKCVIQSCVFFKTNLTTSVHASKRSEDR